MQFLLSRTFAVPTPMALGTAELQCTTAIVSWEIFVYFKSCYSLNSVGHFSIPQRKGVMYSILQI